MLVKRERERCLTEGDDYGEVFLSDTPCPPSQSLSVLTEQLELFKLQDSKVHLTAYYNNVFSAVHSRPAPKGTSSDS